MRRVVSLFARGGVAKVSALGLAVTLFACAGDDDAGIVSLSVTSSDPLTPAIGKTVTFTVRAISGDGTSTDVSDRASCGLSSQAPPGRLEGRVFTAERPGTTDIVCTFSEARGSLGITVPGQLRTTVAKIQKGELAPNTEVELSAIVFKVEKDGRYTNFYAQDQGGGPYSGIYFFDARTPPEDENQDLPAPAAEGDVVTIKGRYLERDGRSIVRYETVTKTGTGKPTAIVVPIAQLDPKVYDGCLVGLENLRVTNAAVDSTTFEVTDAAEPPTGKALVDTYDYDPQVKKDARVTRLFGPLYLKQRGTDPLRVAVSLRNETDIVLGDGGGGGGDVVDSTVGAIQTGAVAESTRVRLKDVVVTAVDADETTMNLFIQDPAGGVNSGLYVRDFRADKAYVAAVGDVVTLEGEYIERRGRSVVNFSVITKTGTRAPKIDVVPAGQLDPVKYESALVRVPDVKVVSAVSGGEFQVKDNGDGGTATIAVDTLFYEPTVRVDDVYASVQGVLYNGQNSWALAPRSAADVGATTFADIGQGRVKIDSLVHFEGLTVVGVRKSGARTDIWVQAPGGGEWGGMRLRNPSSVTGADVAEGDVVSVDGDVDVFSSLPIVFYSKVTKTGTASTPAVVSSVPLATLLDATAGAAWTHGLVRVEQVVVDNPSASFGFTVKKAAAAGSLAIANDIVGTLPTVAAGQGFSAIIGVVIGAPADRDLWPRRAADLQP
jgi:hypothetical protein